MSTGLVGRKVATMSETTDGKKLGAIIVGTGFGVLTHLRAMRLAGIEVIALVGRDPAKTRDRATHSNVSHAMTSLDQALALPGVDLVAIATPPHTHCAIALQAIAAGKHVLCEKPFARNLEEARRMHLAAEDAGVVHLLGTEFRFATPQALAARAIREGLIGEPKLATFLMHVPVLADSKAEVPQWWGLAEQGGGWLGAYCSHIIDQIRTTVGEISGLSASLALVGDHDWSAEDSYTVHFRTRNSCGGTLQSTAGAWGPMIINTRIAGTQGTLWIEGEDVKIANRDGTRSLPVPDDLVTLPPSPPPVELMNTTYDHLHMAGFDIGPYTRLFEYMRDKILGLEVSSDPAPATFLDGVKGQAILVAHNHPRNTAGSRSNSY